MVFQFTSKVCEVPFQVVCLAIVPVKSGLQVIKAGIQIVHVSSELRAIARLRTIQVELLRHGLI